MMLLRGELELDQLIELLRRKARMRQLVNSLASVEFL
jgi:hypothetical protein